VVRCESVNRHQKDSICLKEAGLYAQILLTILGSIVNVMGEPIWPI
jgi:hypothetical protein